MSLLSVGNALDVLVAQLPAATRELLAKGPVDDDEGEYGCGVCNAMDETVGPDGPYTELANMLLDYHDVDGSVGSRCYERCCAIYRAAGWTG